MRPDRLINLLLLLLLSACSSLHPPDLQPTVTPGTPTGQTAAQSPAAAGMPAATALPTLIPTVELPTPTATPTPALLNLTHGLTGNPLSPSWSPDGEYIVFSLDDPGQPNHNQLYLADVDGSGST